jgi:ribosomal protein S4
MIKFIRRYEVDVSSRVILRPKYFNVLKILKRVKFKKERSFSRILKSDRVTKFRHLKRRTLKSTAFKNKQLLKRFYDINYNRYRKILLTIKRSRGDAKMKRFHQILERCLCIVLVRSGLFRTVSHAKKFIYRGAVFVNSVQVRKYAHCLKAGDIITFDKYYFVELFKVLLHNIKMKSLFLSSPNIEVNFNSMSICFIQIPKLTAKSFIFGKANIDRVV